MIIAGDRGERLYRTRRAATTYRPVRPIVGVARYKPRLYRSPSTRFSRFGSRFSGASRGMFGSSSPQEIKSFDVTLLHDTATPLVDVAAVAGIGATNLLTTGMTCINAVQQGAAFYNRVGAKIKEINAQLHFFVSTTATSGMWRYMLVYDRQPNGAFPAITDIIQVNDTGQVGVDTGVNIANKSRFAILRDKRIPIDQASARSWQINEFVPLQCETEYGASTGLIGDLRTGSLLFLVFDSAYNTDAVIAVSNFNSRIRYND